MKEFSCGDVIPGCHAVFQNASEAAILEAVAEHARRDHGFTEISDAVVSNVRAAIHVVAPSR